MIVKDLKKELANYKDEAEVKVITNMEKTPKVYSVEYRPIHKVDDVAIGVGVSVVGIITL